MGDSHKRTNEPGIPESVQVRHFAQELYCQAAQFLSFPVCAPNANTQFTGVPCISIRKDWSQVPGDGILEDVVVDVDGHIVV